MFYKLEKQWISIASMLQKASISLDQPASINSRFPLLNHTQSLRVLN